MEDDQINPYDTASDSESDSGLPGGTCGRPSLRPAEDDEGEGDDGLDDLGNDRVVSTLLIEMDGVLTPFRRHRQQHQQLHDIFAEEAELLLDANQASTGATVIVLATSSRPQAIDAALLRPGRLDLCLPVEAPGESGRLRMLEGLVGRMPLKVLEGDGDQLEERKDRHADGDDELVARKAFLEQLTGGTTGLLAAQLQDLCREAGMNAIRVGCRN